MWGWRLAKVALAAAILIGLARHIHGLWGELRNVRISIQPAWVGLSAAYYAAGLVLFGLFWHRILLDVDGRPGRLATVRAYCVGHLGKYVPGKAWVIVLRCGLLRAQGVATVSAALSALYETATMMAVGAILASLIFLVLGTEDPRLLALAAALSAALGLAVQPPVFGRLSRFVTLPFPSVAGESIGRFRYRTLGLGLAILAPAWFLWGASLSAAIRSVGFQTASLAAWPLMTAVMALATVAGFVVVFMPGGIGVREWVLMVALAPVAGPAVAAIAAVLIRLIWVATELAMAGALYAIRPARRLA